MKIKQEKQSHCWFSVTLIGIIRNLNYIEEGSARFTDVREMLCIQLQNDYNNYVKNTENRLVPEAFSLFFEYFSSVYESGSSLVLITLINELVVFPYTDIDMLILIENIRVYSVPRNFITIMGLVITLMHLKNFLIYVIWIF